jgi:hypothetical protein
MRRSFALLTALVLIASLGASSVAAVTASQPSSFHGDFDMLDQGSGQAVGHIVVDLHEQTNARQSPGSLDVYWASGNPIRKSHARLSGVWFGQEFLDPGWGAVRSAGATGTLCDTGTGRTSCAPFAVIFYETVDPAFTNYVGWSVPGSSECCGGAWYQVGMGAFALSYLGSVSKVSVAIPAPSDAMSTSGSRTFTATVSGAAIQSVYWSVKEPDGGSITPDGVYTAPATPGTYTVTATSQADVRASASIRVTVTCGTVVSMARSSPATRSRTSAKYEPPDGYAYFGFSYRLWEGDASWGDTRPFAARICDAVDVELAGKTPTTLFVWNMWQSSDGTGTMLPFSTVLPDIERIHAALGPSVVPLVEWMLGGGDWTLPTYTGPTTKDVASGSLDGYIRQYALDVKRYGQPLFIRLICGEFNGNWGAMCSPKANPKLTRADFVNAWRRVVDIFHQQGVTNVAWLWNPNVPLPPGLDWGWDPKWKDYYPGDAYVDWVGVDIYPIAQPEWIDPVYSFATAHGKPIFIGEFGLGIPGSGYSHADDVAHLKSMFAYVASHPAIKGISYFNYKAAPDPNYADESTHTYLYDGQVNYAPDVLDEDNRLLAGGPDIRALYASLIGNPRYVSTLVTGP